MIRARCLAAGLGVLAAAPAAQADRIPFQEANCDLGALGINDPQGVTFNPSDGYGIVDDTANRVFFVSETCAVTSSFSTVPLGATTPTGIANDFQGTYVLVDRATAALVFTDATGVQLGSCDLGAYGAVSPAGVTYDLSRGAWAIVDAAVDQVLFADNLELGGSPCNLVGLPFDTPPFGANNPTGITHRFDTDGFAITDSSSTVFLVGPTGQLEDTFETALSLGLTQLVGIFYRFQDERYWILNNNPALVEVDATATSTFKCSTTGVLSNDPAGVTYNPGTDELVFVDSVTNEVHIVDGTTCASVRSFPVPSGTSASGVAYLASTDELAITDLPAGTVSFVGYVSEALNGSCATIAAPSSIDAIDDLGLLVISSALVDSWVITDLSCSVVHTRSAVSLTGGTGSPEGVAFHVGSGATLLTDTANDDVHIANFEGALERRFDTAGLGLGDVLGITHLPVSGSVFNIVDTGVDAVYEFDVPQMTAPKSLSGRFSSASATGYFFERGGGRYTGTLFLNANVLPLFGQYNAGPGTLAFGAVAPSGSPVAVSATVSADLNMIFAPSPVGTMTRDY